MLDIRVTKLPTLPTRIKYRLLETGFTTLRYLVNYYQEHGIHPEYIPGVGRMHLHIRGIGFKGEKILLDFLENECGFDWKILLDDFIVCPYCGRKINLSNK
jgi:hypothetical protein